MRLSRTHLDRPLGNVQATNDPNYDPNSNSIKTALARKKRSGDKGDGVLVALHADFGAGLEWRLLLQLSALKGVQLLRSIHASPNNGSTDPNSVAFMPDASIGTTRWQLPTI